ncbi:MAG TPA: outer membrane protein assembly factor BamA [Thermoanaerobaculia bacterium]|nr:outer membrane protein assembly factor BamA [Thermoanaerobaculia bacterium]
MSCQTPSRARGPLCRLLVVTTLWTSCWFTLPPPAGGQESVPVRDATFEGATIVGIEVFGNRTVAQDTLEYYLGVEPGRAFSRAELDRNIKRLWDRELIDDISVEAVPAESSEHGRGVRLVVRVEERPRVTSVEYQGLKRISVTDLRDRLSAERISLEEGGPLNLGELYRVKHVIEEMYAEKGYRFAQAEQTLEAVREGERKVVFTIDEGDRVRIGDIQFEGNTVFRDARLRWEMKKTKESGPISRVFKKDIYNPASLAEDLDKVRDAYREAGYKNVVIGEPRIQVSSSNPGAPADEQKRRLVLTVPIEEGNRWRFGEVRVEGNAVFEDAPLLRAFEYRPGDWLRSKQIDEGVEAVQEIYQNTGYIQARVEPELVEVSDEEADVVIHVREGDQYQVGRLEFEGNTRTMDKVLRREFRVQEGRVLSLGALRNSLYKIRQLGYFELNEEDPIGFEFNQEDNTVDLTVQGREADRTELQFGAGYSEGLGYFGQFSLRTQNFLGRGEQVGVSVQSGALTEFYEVSYFVPWFLDRPQSFGIQAYDRTYDFDFLENQREIQESTGGAFTYGRSLGLFQSLSVAYSYSDQSYLQRLTRDGEANEFFTELEISSIRPAYVRDSVDNRFEPRVGSRLSASVEYAGGVLGGSEYFVRPIAGYTLYRPVTGYPFETVFGLNVEAGVVEPFGGRDLERFVLFRLGGDTSVRGFERYRLYARNEDTGDFLVDQNGFPVGGDRYFQANLEYHLILNGPFRFILFADAGQVYAPEIRDAQGALLSGAQSFDLGRLRYTAGAELRIILPLLGGAPLRFIYASNLTEEPNDEFNTFSFSIGSTF